MKKTAVFVEGQAELILIRELLLRIYDYQKIGIECYALIQNNLQNADYNFGSRSEESFYMIINAGNDDKVLSSIKKRFPGLHKQGFSKIIGIKDMYGQKYKTHNKEARTINYTLIQRFINSSNVEIKEMNSPVIICYHYAIMEVETWFLGIKNMFESIDPSLTNSYIHNQLKIDLENCDLEKDHTFYHPAKIVDNIFKLAGRRYDKHERDVSPLILPLEKEHYVEFKESNRCSTFTRFVEELIN